MYLAIIGALMLLDKFLPGLLDVYIPIFVAVILIVYTTKYDYLDSLLLSASAFVVTLLFGNIYLVIYDFIAIACGLIYGACAKRAMDKRLLCFVAMITFIIGEFIFTIFLLPLFGISDMQEMFDILKETFSSFNIAVTDTLLRSIYSMSIFFTGMIEGLLVHLLAVIVLAKLKIKVLASLSIENMKMPPIIGYICFGLFAIMAITYNMALPVNISYVIMCVGMICALLLCAQGYIFAIIYGYIVHKRNMALMVILIIIFLMPLSLIALVILGFLYATGPLDRYLKNKRGNV